MSAKSGLEREDLLGSQNFLDQQATKLELSEWGRDNDVGLCVDFHGVSGNQVIGNIMAAL